MIAGQYIDPHKLSSTLNTKLGKGTYQVEVCCAPWEGLRLKAENLQMRHNKFYIYAREQLTMVCVIS